MIRPTFLSLSTDLRNLIASFLKPEDRIALLFTRKAFQSLETMKELKQFPLQKGIRSAASFGSISLVQWFVLQLHCSPKDVCTVAAEKGHLPLLKWAREQGFPENKETCAAAAKAGQLEALKMLRGINSENAFVNFFTCLAGRVCPWDKETVNAAAFKGDIKLLKWLQVNKCPTDVTACNAAAHGGHIEVMQLLRETGAAWNAGVCEAAAFEGHLELLKWLISQGCPWDPVNCAYQAARGGKMNILNWMHANSHPCWNAKLLIVEIAKMTKNLDLLQWLSEKGCPI